MSNFINITKEQWEEMTETLWTDAQWAELWVKEREGLASMLGAAKEALTAAQNDAQAADCYGNRDPHIIFPISLNQLYALFSFLFQQLR